VSMSEVCPFREAFAQGMRPLSGAFAKQIDAICSHTIWIRVDFARSIAVGPCRGVSGIAQLASKAPFVVSYTVCVPTVIGLVSDA